MSERLYTFAIDELGTITCKCPKCSNVLTYNAETEPKYGIPAACATCREPLEQLTKALVLYRDFYRAAKESGLVIRLHTKPVSDTDVPRP
jgi:hypothetical protein